MDSINSSTNEICKIKIFESNHFELGFYQNIKNNSTNENLSSTETKISDPYEKKKHLQNFLIV
jgi:hypothetical protein